MGHVLLNEAFLNDHDRTDDSVRQVNVLDQFRAKTSAPFFKEIWVISNGHDHIDLLTRADRAFVIEPVSHDYSSCPTIQQVRSFSEIQLTV